MHSCEIKTINQSFNISSILGNFEIDKSSERPVQVIMAPEGSGREESMRREELHQQHEILLRNQTRTLLRREMEYLSSTHQGPLAPPRPQKQHSQWRSKICEWCYRVIDHFQYDRKVVSISMEYFDRFLLLHPNAENMSSRAYQLAAMTSLYVAMKLHGDDEDTSPGDVFEDSLLVNTSEPRKRRLRLQSFVELSRGQFLPQDILSMEMVLLETLQWKVNPVTPMCFVSYFLKLFPRSVSRGPKCNFISSYPDPPALPQQNSDSQSAHVELVMHVLHELSRYLTELAICLPCTSSDPNNAKPLSPSTVAYASILLSMDMISFSALPNSMRNAFNESCSQLSVEAGFTPITTFSSSSDLTSSGPESVFTKESTKSNMVIYLHPEQPEVKYLKRMIRNNFIPEMILDQATPSYPGNDSNIAAQQLHPIAIAKEAGLLNMQFFSKLSYSSGRCHESSDEVPTSPCTNPPSPTSVLDSPNPMAGTQQYQGSHCHGCE